MKSEELYFVMTPAIEEADLGATVCFTTKKCWESNKYQSDNLGGHNMPEKILTACGVCPDELMESIFELTGEFTPEEVKTKLLAAGFEENEEFTAFINK